MLYFKDMLEQVQPVEGDIVECGVSIGHGTLLFTLLSDYLGKPRTYYGFDSFKASPHPSIKTKPHRSRGAVFGPVRPMRS